MTREQAIIAEVRRVAAAAANHQPHLAHIRVRALERLRGVEGCTYPATWDTDVDERAGDRMFGDDHTIRPAELATVA